MSKLNESENNNLKIVYLGLGSNIDPVTNIKLVINKLADQFNLKKVSRIWESEPVGSSGPTFLNGVVLIETILTYDYLKQRLRVIEADLGRVRSNDKYAPRQIDIDVLIFGDRIIDTDIWVQPYIAVPLAEIYPSLYNPSTGENIQNISKLLLKGSDIHPRIDVL